MSFGHLNTLQRNDFARLINRRGFRRADFEWEMLERFDAVMEPGSYPCLRHKATGQFFAFALKDPPKGLRGRGPHAVSYTPGEDSRGARVYYARWDEAFKLFDLWVRRVRRTVDEGDLWARDEIDPGLLVSAATAEANTPFTGEEIRRIGETLDRFLGEVEQKRLMTPEHLAQFARDMAHHKNTASTFGRIDWRNAFVGGLITQIFALGLTKENASALIALARQAFGWLAQHLSHLPAVTP
jgi:hypothetical protein